MSYEYRTSSFSDVPEHIKYVSSGLLSPPPLPDFSSFTDESTKLLAIAEYYKQIAKSPLATIVLDESNNEKQIQEEKQKLEGKILELSNEILAMTEILTEEKLRNFTEQLKNIRDRLASSNLNVEILQNLRAEIESVSLAYHEIKSIYEKLIHDKKKTDRLRQQIESIFHPFRLRILSEIVFLPPELQEEIKKRLDEFETRLGVVFSLDDIQNLLNDMENFQIKINEKVAENALAKRLKLVPTVLAKNISEKPGLLQKLKRHLIGETARDHIREFMRLGMFIEGVVTLPLLSVFGITPEPIMGIAALLAGSSIMIRSGLVMGEIASPMIEARYPKAAEILRKLCAGKSLSYMSRLAGKIVDIPMPLLSGLMAGGLLEKSIQMLPGAYNWVHLPTIESERMGNGEHSTAPPNLAPSASGSTEHNGGSAILPPAEGSVPKSIVELVPQNGRSVTDYELDFITGHWQGYEQVSTPSQYNVGAINVLKNLDKALAEMTRTNFTSPQDGSYRLLDRGLAEKALNTYIEAMQRLPKDWTMSQLNDSQYGLSEYQKLLLKAGYGGQYLNQSEFQIVINNLKGVK